MIVVTCPLCNEDKHLITKPQYFFKCCGIAHRINDYIRLKGFSNKEKGGINERKNDNKGKVSGTRTERKGVINVEGSEGKNEIRIT